jgi:hypothetical protein
LKRAALLVVSILLAAALLATALFALNLTRTEGSSSGAALASEDYSSPRLAPGEAALRATINPETGRVEVSTVGSNALATVSLDAATTEALRRDTEGLKQTFHPDGSVSVNLEGRFQNVSVARIDENGKVVICTEDADHVNGVIEGRAVGKPVEGQAPEVR